MTWYRTYDVYEGEPDEEEYAEYLDEENFWDALLAHADETLEREYEDG